MDNGGNDAMRSATLLQDLLEKHFETRIRVTDIHVVGAEKTHMDVFDRELEAVYDAETLQEVVERAGEAQERLRALDIFRSMSISIEPSPNGQKDSVVVAVRVAEMKTLGGKIGTYVRKNEGSAEAAISVRNLFGRGENVTFSAEAYQPLGTDLPTAGFTDAFTRNVGAVASAVAKKIKLGQPANNMIYSGTLTVPYFLNSNTTLKTSVFQSIQDQVLRSSFSEKKRGVEFSLLPRSLPGHAFRLSAEWREITAMSNEGGASVAVHREPRHAVKSSIGHMFTLDRRNDNLAPTEGNYLKIDTELAGIGGDVKFLKHEGTYQYHLPLFKWDEPVEREDGSIANVSFPRAVSAHIGIGYGMILPLADDYTRISDRFFIGGGLKLRGFRTARVGPQEPRSSGQGLDALGGDVYGIASLSLSAPCPVNILRRLLGARVHAFVNAGNNAALPSAGIPTPDWGKRFIENVRASAGVGLVLPTRFGRIEVNACLPFRVLEERGDREKKIQLGLGIDFL